MRSSVWYILKARTPHSRGWCSNRHVAFETCFLPITHLLTNLTTHAVTPNQARTRRVLASSLLVCRGGTSRMHHGGADDGVVNTERERMNGWIVLSNSEPPKGCSCGIYSMDHTSNKTAVDNLTINLNYYLTNNLNFDYSSSFLVMDLYF